MGVPAFFRWISARYPLIMQKIYEDAEVKSSTCHVLDESGGIVAQPVDNLYLDCNGIVHPCCHPEGGAKQPENEDEMFQNVNALIERLFNVIKPKNLLYLALDGVAPRAKMNQQRTRRFCSAREFEEQEEARRELGIPKHDSWDHNQITPGTPFMDRLAKSLREYVKLKQSTDKAWQGIVVIIDDSSNPGEGEHKIMDYIRRWRSSENYSPDISHAICGQDADLIHLGLALHEPKVLILRERVEFQKKSFTKKKKNNTNSNVYDKQVNKLGGAEDNSQSEADPPKGMDFLNIERLRQYLFLDFIKAFQTEEMMHISRMNPLFQFNLEKIIDDFIFICFFVGNDFLPHLPSLSIRDGSLDLLLNIYTMILPQLNGYINNEGVIDLQRVELLISKFGLMETVILKKKQLDEQASARRDMYRAQSSKSNLASQQGHAQSQPQAAAETGAPAAEVSSEELRLQFDKLVLEKSEKLVESSGENNKPMDVDQPNYKYQYYRQKILDDEVSPVNANVPQHAEEEDAEGFTTIQHRVATRNQGQLAAMNSLVVNMKTEYMKGLCWVALYYAQKVPSWTWFYPYHYAPFASDLNDLVSLYPMTFELGEPFSPLTQLMAVLPARSSHCVPPAYRSLMESPSSSLASNYHLDFKLDPNNKPAAMRWLWVARIPFMNTARLVQELSKITNQLTNEEKIRNSFHEVEIFYSSRHEVNHFNHVLEASSPAEGSYEKQWKLIKGAPIEGLMCPPRPSSQKIKTTSSDEEENISLEGEEKQEQASVIRNHYKLNDYVTNKSVLHVSFMTRPLALSWAALQESLPRKPVRLPITYEQLHYVVYTDASEAVHAVPAAHHQHHHQHNQSGYQHHRHSQTNPRHAAFQENAGGSNKCWYFTSPQGCHYGARCKFSHDA